MRRLKSLPKSLIMFTLLMGSFLTAKPAQAGLPVREASVRNPSPPNVVNYYGIRACFGTVRHSRNYFTPWQDLTSAERNHWRSQGYNRRSYNRKFGNLAHTGLPYEDVFFAGKIHDGYCNYPTNGREERASNYNVIIENKLVFWRRDEAGFRQAQSQIGNRQLRHVGVPICGVEYRGGHHVGQLTQRGSDYICTIGWGGDAVEFDWGDFDIPVYAE